MPTQAVSSSGLELLPPTARLEISTSRSVTVASALAVPLVWLLEPVEPVVVVATLILALGKVILLLTQEEPPPLDS
jgi:hypothetical protein